MTKKARSMVSEDMAFSRSFIARQPIFDCHKEVVSYELLFRGGPENAFSGIDGTKATVKVMSNSLMTFSLKVLTEGKPALVNVNTDILASGLIKLFPKERIIPELLEDVSPTPDVLLACRDLISVGYRLALDDVIQADRYEPFAGLASIIKVDFMGADPATQAAIAEKLLSRSVTLLAEKVETHEEFERAKGQGYTLFQGYFFAKPEVLSATEVPPNKMQHLQLIRELSRTDIALDRIEQILRGDVSLSYRLLRYMNSAQFALRTEVRSINHALTLLGPRDVRRWATLVTLAGMGDDKPAELISVGLVRARFCEQISGGAGLGGCVEDLFLVGLFSVLEALIECPLERVLGNLSLDDDIKQALLTRSGPLGPVLSLTMAYEQGDWDTMSRYAGDLGVAETAVAECYIEAVSWAGRYKPGRD